VVVVVQVRMPETVPSRARRVVSPADDPRRLCG
jgi:hypothetical protein